MLETRHAFKPPANVAMLPSGTRLGPYEVLGLIGDGGMGQVYRVGGLYAPNSDGRRFLIAMPAPSTDVVPMELQINRLTPP